MPVTCSTTAHAAVCIFLRITVNIGGTSLLYKDICKELMMDSAAVSERFVLFCFVGEEAFRRMT